MNIDIISLIYPEKAKLIKEGKCPICEQPVDQGELRDDFSRKEYSISGMCQKCQDDTFKLDYGA